MAHDYGKSMVVDQNEADAVISDGMESLLIPYSHSSRGFKRVAHDNRKSMVVGTPQLERALHSELHGD